MSFSLPDGSKFYLGTTLASPLTVTAVTNASPGVASVTAHGLSTNDEVLFSSGWDEVNESIYRVTNLTSGTFSFQDLDTTDTNYFPAGTGIGTVEKVTAWTEIAQVEGVSMSGGDPKFAPINLLSRRVDSQMPAGFNASSMEFTIHDDNSLAGYQAILTASRSTAKRPVKIVFAGGTYGYFYAYVACNDMPTLNKGETNKVKVIFSIVNKFIRY